MRNCHIALRTDGKPGDGSQSNPYNGTDFDAAIIAVKRKAGDDPVKVIVGPGVFLTRGVAPGKNWTIRGNGMFATCLRLADVGATSFHHPNIYVVATANYGGSDPEWNEAFSISDLTLDADWTHQSARETTNVKYGGVYVQSARATIQRVRAINWGSNGLNLDHSEAFPIMGVTYSDEDTRLLIEDCIAERQYRYRGGYATAFNVVTCQDILQPDGSVSRGGDRIPWRSRKSVAAIVRRNQAFDIYGHAIGCGHTENAVFEGNLAVHCKTLFNCDTGRNRNVTIRGNTVSFCNQGVHIGSITGGDFAEFSVEGNLVRLTEKWLNEILDPQKYEFSYGVRLHGNTKMTRITQNSIACMSGMKSLADGSYGIGTGGDSNHHITMDGNEFSGLVNDSVRNVPGYV